MTLIVGTDTYATLAEARAIAESRGWSFPVDDTNAEIALRNGADYVDMQEPRFNGDRLDSSQAMAWPRTGATYCDGREIADGAYPSELLRAQVAAAVEYGSGTDVRASTDGRNVASEAVSGAVSVSYFDNGQTGATITITKAMDALKPLFSGGCGSPLTFRVMRA